MTIRLGSNISSYLSGRKSVSNAASRGEYTNGILQNHQGDGGQSTKNIAFSLREHGTTLADSGKNSIISKAVESGDTKEVRNEVTEFVDDYNSLISRLNKNGETMDLGYVKELGTMIAAAGDELKKVGIEMGKGGKLVLDKTVLGEAKAEDLQKCFQGADSVASKIATKSVAIGMNAVSSSTENSIFGQEQDLEQFLSNNEKQSSVTSSARAARYRARYNQRV